MAKGEVYRGYRSLPEGEGFRAEYWPLELYKLKLAPPDKDFAGKVDFIAQNVKTADFGDPVFKPYVIRTINHWFVRCVYERDSWDEWLAGAGEALGLHGGLRPAAGLLDGEALVSNWRWLAGRSADAAWTRDYSNASLLSGEKAARVLGFRTRHG